MLIYLLVFVNGLVIMGMELTASRLLAPYFGTTILVWTNLIGAIMMFLSLGYYIGGTISERRPIPKLLYSLTLAAGIYIGFLPIMARPVMSLVAKTSSAGSFFGVMAVTFLLLAPPTLLMGCVVPFAVRLKCLTAKKSGKVAGKIYAVATVGSVLGVYIPVMLLVPTVGTRATFLVLSSALTLVSLAGVARPAPLLLLAAYIPVVQSLGAPISTLSTNNNKFLGEWETPYNYVRLIGFKDSIIMQVNDCRMHYSSVRVGKRLSQMHADLFLPAPLFNSRYGESGFPGRILVLGVAGGAASQLMRTWHPGAEITGVDIDPGLIRIADREMGLEGVLDHVVIEDGRNFLRKCDTAYDLIIHDAYQQTYIPFHLATEEFFKEAKSCLAPGGVLAMNVAWKTESNREFLDHVVSTVSRVFPVVYTASLGPSDNSVLYAVNGRARDKDIRARLAAVRDPDMKIVLDLIGDTITRWNPDENVRPFTDDWAPVEGMVDRIWYGTYH